MICAVQRSDVYDVCNVGCWNFERRIQQYCCCSFEATCAPDRHKYLISDTVVPGRNLNADILHTINRYQKPGTAAPISHRITQTIFFVQQYYWYDHVLASLVTWYCESSWVLSRADDVHQVPGIRLLESRACDCVLAKPGQEEVYQNIFGQRRLRRQTTGVISSPAASKGVHEVIHALAPMLQRVDLRNRCSFTYCTTNTFVIYEV